MGKELGQTEEGVILDVKVEYGHKKCHVVWWQEHHHLLKVGVTETPHKGRENGEIIDLLSRRLTVDPANISVIKGEHHDHKQILIKSIKPEDIKKKLK